MRALHAVRTLDIFRSGGQHKNLIIQGEYRVSDDPDAMLTTLLGSCVAACLRDPHAGVGGMNHFLLPGPETDSQTDPAARESGVGEGSLLKEAERYGVHLMELLVNGLLRSGARRERLEAKLFGGARTLHGLADIGARNAGFAERFLRNEGIRLIGGSLRGDQGRRIQFWPVTGRARQILLLPNELPPPERIDPHKVSGGGVEFF
jgi:chemotaxis protein CheD